MNLRRLAVVPFGQLDAARGERFMPTKPPPPYAVVFSPQRTQADPQGYEAMAEHMVALAATMPGLLGVESARVADSFGITVSYWDSPESIRNWHEHAEHKLAQAEGRRTWYASFRLRVCRVEREYWFER
jgi:heme-degrading monooxygenase HmoA